MFNIQRSNTGKNRRRDNNLLGGLLLLVVGTVLLVRQTGSLGDHKWLFTWPMILVVVGLFVGLKHRFRDFGWLILISIGIFFLFDMQSFRTQFGVDSSFRNYVWPVVIITGGLLLIFRPRRKLFYDEIYTSPTDEKEPGKPESIPYERIPGTTEDELDVVSIFGGIKKNVLSKNFKGGDIVSIFGGSEIDMTMADFDKKIVIDTVQIFGGTTLIIPSNWQIRSEAVTIFGGIDDKRRQLTHGEPERILILKGFTMFGGLEIKSY
jgi:predicted membrane protein